MQEIVIIPQVFVKGEWVSPLPEGFHTSAWVPARSQTSLPSQNGYEASRSGPTLSRMTLHHYAPSCVTIVTTRILCLAD